METDITDDDQSQDFKNFLKFHFYAHKNFRNFFLKKLNLDKVLNMGVIHIPFQMQIVSPTCPTVLSRHEDLLKNLVHPEFASFKRSEFDSRLIPIFIIKISAS